MPREVDPKMATQSRLATRGALLVAMLLLCAATAARAQAPASAGAQSAGAQLRLTGDVTKPLTLTQDDLRHMPRTTLKATNEHDDNQQQVYEGVLLSDLLKQAGAPQGAQLRGAAMAAYVVAEGADGYRVTFSVAELDSGFQDSQVIVADTMNGAPMGDKVGPLRLVVPQDKRPARWVRMLDSIRVVNIPK